MTSFLVQVEDRTAEGWTPIGPPERVEAGSSRELLDDFTEVADALRLSAFRITVTDDSDPATQKIDVRWLE